MGNTLRELRFALRQIRKAPLFSATIILILGLATGGNAAIFSVLDGLWLRPLAVPHPTDVVRVFAVTDQSSDLRFSYPVYRELAKQSADVVQLAAVDHRGARVPRPDGSFELITVNGVSSNFFTTLGVRAALGKVFDPSDDNSAAPEVAVLGDSYWRRVFGADREILGKQIRVVRGERAELVTVIGVLPESFRELDASSDRDLWLPTRTWKRLSNLEEEGYRGFEVVGRLVPGISRAKVESKLQTIAAALAQQSPDTNRGRRVRVVSDLKQRWEDAGVNGEMLLAIVGLIMLLCAVNIANLLLARGAQREHELSIRLSLGANRWQLFQHLFVESIALGIAGLAFGMVIGNALILVLPSLFVPPPNMHPVFTFALNGRVMLVSTVVGLLTTFLFGCFPAIRTATSARASVTPVSSSGAQRRSLQVHRWLVVTQVSISLVLLVGAGLVVRSFRNTRTADLGIARNALLNVWMTSPIPEQPSLLQEIRENLQSIPGVHRVAVAVRAPLSLSSGGMARIVEIPDAPQPPGSAPREILYNSVSSNYLKVIGTPVLRGRGFQDSDGHPGSNAVVINETMARSFWKEESPIDKSIKIGKAGREYRVIGVAQDAPIAQLSDRAVPYMYLPFASEPEGEQTFILDVDGDPALIDPIVRFRLTQLHSNIVLLGMTTEGELIRYAAGEYQVTAVLVSALGLLAMCLTAAGLYGAVSYAVTRRTKEIGIRMALGASRRDALVLVMREITGIAALGIVVGIPATLICTRLSAAAFFGVHPWHLPTLLSVIALVTLVLFVAGYGPAQRASRIDPMLAIRQE